MRIIAISDTHSMHRTIKEVPDGDVLVHCGDLCGQSSLEQIDDFASWMASQPHAHKIVVAGNHDWPFQTHSHLAVPLLVDHGLTYLHESAVKIGDLRFWGSPWTPEFFNWAFMYARGPEAERRWAAIPDDTDVLITHGPPRGILDTCPPYPRPPAGTPMRDVHVGCDALRAAVLERVHPKAHLFGHIHEGSGEEKVDEVQFVNASTCTGAYRPTNAPRVVDV